MIKCLDPNGCLYETRCVYDNRCHAGDIANRISPTKFDIKMEDAKQAVENKPRIPEFIDLLEQSKAIHLKKNADYANASNPFSNFERSAELINWFNNSTDKAFVALIATKLARIAELSDGRSPNNESLDDSFLDLLTYVGLWGAYVKRNRIPK
jgi:hypothetical protein